jgi:hypothetical protein
MALAALAETGADIDVLRQIVQFMAQRPTHGHGQGAPIAVGRHRFAARSSAGRAFT